MDETDIVAEETSDLCEAEPSTDEQANPSTLLKSLATYKRLEKLKSKVDDTRVGLDRKILSDRYFALKRKSEQTRQIQLRDDTSIYESNFDCALTITGSNYMGDMEELVSVMRRVR